MSNQIVTLESVVYGVERAFDQVLVDTSINFKREAEFALQILYSNEYAKGLALSNPQSVRDAVTNVAAIGISLNPARKLAYLVPREKKICLDVSYRGLMEIAIASGSVMWAQGAVVHESEVAGFHLNGIDKPPTHERNPFAKNKGQVVGAYVVAKTRDGDYITTAMSDSEINDIRDRSSAWKAFASKGKSCPWSTDYSAMAVKTVVKSATRWWPKSERLDRATHYLNTDGGEGIDFGNQGDTQAQEKQRFSAAEIVAQIDAAQDDKLISTLRREGLSAASAARDKGAYDRIQAAVLRRRIEIGSIIENEGVTQ